ncbi:36705_t:CDS:2, partial [Gigaspora margarita]
NLVFYMDGFLVRTPKERGRIDRMGASWVQIDLDKEKILDLGYVGPYKQVLVKTKKPKPNVKYTQVNKTKGDSTFFNQRQRP